MQLSQARKIITDYQKAHRIDFWFAAFLELQQAEIKSIEQSRAVVAINDNFRRLLNPEQLYQKES